MKKILFVMTSVLLFSPCSSFAAKMYIDGMANYGNYGDASKMIGYGGGFGFELIPDVAVYMRFFHASDSKTSGGKTVEKYQEDAFAVCVDYNYQLGMYPLYWKTYGGVGPSRVRIRNVDWLPDNEEKKETGLFFGLWTGLRYDVSQHFGLFGVVGYQRTTGFKSDLSGSKVGGYQIAIGVTATVFGSNSRVDKGY